MSRNLRKRLDDLKKLHQGDDVGEIIIELLPVEFDADGNVIDRPVEIIVTRGDERQP